ncbi:uncharacterized protein, partial [Aegilops tauschii subsp. strangulata]|uniref:uncharacterized protein n=1 Tax=Aegilops tauschii subsp. strangulata TaxID=200361 RepID=UPI001E1CAB5D
RALLGRGVAARRRHARAVLADVERAAAGRLQAERGRCHNVELEERLRQWSRHRLASPRATMSSPSASALQPPASSPSDACVLLLRCRHMSLCSACEPAVATCPVCVATKYSSFHVKPCRQLGRRWTSVALCSRARPCLIWIDCRPCPCRTQFNGVPNPDCCFVL